MPITKKKFLAFEKVREGGKTNMLDIKNVISLARAICDVYLTREDCLEMMQNYQQYVDQYLK